MKGKTALRCLKIMGNVLLYLFLIVCLVMLVCTVTAKKSKDGAPVIFGHEIRLVLSDSMEKCSETDVSNYKIRDLPVHSAIFVEVVPEDAEQAEEWYASLKVGDVLTFRYLYGRQTTITHRLVKIEEKQNGGYLLTLQGDNKAPGSNQTSQVIDTSEKGSFNYVIGKVTGKSNALGYLIYVLKRPLGIICIVIVPCALIVAWEIIRITDIANKKKKKKLEEENRKKELEIEELKRLLADLEKNQNKQEPGGM